jgi:hypothetical protein
MDRVMIEQDLAMVEQHVTLGLLHIERQVQIIATLKRQGHFAAEAQAARILVTFEEMQMEHEVHRDRLWRKLQETKQGGVWP